MARRTWQSWKRVRPIPVSVWVAAGLFWIVLGLIAIFD